MSNPTESNGIVEWLQKNWFIFAALMAAGIAWGQAEFKIQNLEDAVKSNTETIKQVQELRIKSERIDEKMQNIQASMSRQERQLDELLRSQRSQAPLSARMK